MPSETTMSAFNAAEERYKKRMAAPVTQEQFEQLRIRIHALEHEGVALKVRVQTLETDVEDVLCQRQEAVEHN